MTAKLLCGLLIVIMTSACATRGADFSADLGWIEKNRTTKSQVASRLGEPFQVGFASGSPTWTFGYYKLKLFGTSDTKELKIYWTDDGKVESYSFTSSFPEDKRRAMSPK